MINIAVIAAAGSGTRMMEHGSKLLLKLCDKTIIERTVEVFDSLDIINKIIVVIRQCDFDVMSDLLMSKKVMLVLGGDTRQQSIINAVNAIEKCDNIIIHDGARPLVTADEIINTLNTAQKTGAAATGVFVKDTIKVVDDDNNILSTPDRSHLVSVQTPQIFNFDLYKKAVQNALANGKDYTDDCALVENTGAAVSVVLGKYTNIKITTPEDIKIAQSILNGRE